MTDTTAVTDKERRQQTIIGIAVTIIVTLVLLGAALAIYSSHHNNADSEASAYSTLQQTRNKPSKATDKGGIPVSVGGQTHNDVPTIEIYVDPLCPACGQVDRILNPTVQQLFEAGQINIEIHPVAFLDKASNDQYSTRASAALAYVAEHDAKHLVTFMGALFEQNYQPSEANYISTSDSQIAEQAVRSGIDTSTAKRAVSGQYRSWIDASTTYTISRKVLQDPSGGGFATPLFRINQHMWSMSNMQLSDLSNSLLRSIGLDKADVGNAHVKPAIGANGKPE